MSQMIHQVVYLALTPFCIKLLYETIQKVHRNRAYTKSVKELLMRHKKLLEYEPAEVSQDVFKFSQRRRIGSLIQTHVRFRHDYAEVQKYLVSLFNRLFAMQGDSRDAFEVVITFNAILYCQDAGTYSLFYGTDHRYKNSMGAANELSYGGTYLVQNLSDVVNVIPHQFDTQDLLYRHRNAFPNSNVSVFKILNIIYLIYQYREG